MNILSLYNHLISGCKRTNCSSTSIRLHLSTSLRRTSYRICTRRPSSLVNSDRIRSRSELRITSGEHLRTRLHSLQAQARRESIARVVCEEVLEEGILYILANRHLGPKM
jgi:hypothetical protein